MWVSLDDFAGMTWNTVMAEFFAVGEHPRALTASRVTSVHGIA